MRNWNITINGIGCHRNKGNPADADELAKEFIDHLKEMGQTVTDATFASGVPESIEGGSDKS